MNVADAADPRVCWSIACSARVMPADPLRRFHSKSVPINVARAPILKFVFQFMNAAPF